MDADRGRAALMPHLHLSLQAGDDMILKRMKRRHLRDDASAFLRRTRARVCVPPDIVFGADIIAGFPTETEADVRAPPDHRGICPRGNYRGSGKGLEAGR
jgi:threonylcarbamoyladenosine tRNA methylthiotransferase MtaB